ncbi:MAG: winged helix-turn-helix transcriptional regulator [Candidatus Omnitrophica bacterium]|nr:winged helix-turn-helix transcriptional regulator [Candidatus Omnitrophota bacterium]
MKTNLSIEKLSQAAKVLRCIAHPDRLRIVECLEHKTLSVNQLIEKLGLDQAVVSKHLSVLRRGGIVSSKVDKNFRRYVISYPNVLNVLNCMRKHGGK